MVAHRKRFGWSDKQNTLWCKQAAERLDDALLRRRVKVNQDVPAKNDVELAEGAVVEKVEHALLALGRRLTGPLGGDRRISTHGEAKLQAGAGERGPGTERER